MSFLHIAIIVVCVFIIGVLLVNAAFFNHENNGKTGGISSTTAWAMIFLNLMFIVPLGILLAVSTYELVKGTEAARKVRDAAESIRLGALDTTSAGGVRVTRTVKPGPQTTAVEVSALPSPRRSPRPGSSLSRQALPRASARPPRASPAVSRSSNPRPHQAK